ncbi:MAG TPA: AarF/UbiB family protein [Polyangiales bacterium]|nr:AarF/UbiB family protein [Polyangiales bacterium]
MSLLVRFTRALFAFSIILGDYLSQRYLTKLVAPRKLDPETGRRRRKRPQWLKERGDRVDERNAQRLLDTMLALRGVYIKLGQVLSIMGGFLPRVYIKKLSVLQDKVPPHPYDEVEAVFKRELERTPDQLYKSFEKEALAAASLGQVHVAYLQDGSKVAVKILYPGIREIIRIDMIIVRLAIRVYKWFVPLDSIENAYHSLVDLLERETDYLHEARCMKRMAQNFKDQDDILFPATVDELTTRDVLTMTFMEGVKITNFEAFEQLGIERKVVATRLIQAFYKQMFIDRFFHADPHPGNFLVQKGDDGRPRIVVLDFGAISEAKDNLIDGLLDVVQGMFSGEADKLVDGFLTMGFVAEGADRAALSQLTREYFGKLMKFKDRSPAAFLKQKPSELREAFGNPDVDLDDLRDLMKSVHYPDTWFYVERAIVLLFWLSATIDNTIDGVQVGFPYVLPLLMEHNRKAAEARAAREAAAKALAEQRGDLPGGALASS